MIRWSAAAAVLIFAPAAVVATNSSSVATDRTCSRIPTPESDGVFMLRSAFSIFAMQAGFSLLEAGNVRRENKSNIMLKNLFDMVLGILGWWLTGWAFAYGKDNGNGFIGTSGFFVDEVSDITSWTFQLSFAATAATIDSGAVAERMKFSAYLILSYVTTSVVYPIAAHWVWSADGWLGNMGFTDFAGSCVVHMLGACSALVAAIMLGPRLGRFSADMSTAGASVKVVTTDPPGEDADAVPEKPQQGAQTARSESKLETQAETETEGETALEGPPSRVRKVQVPTSDDEDITEKGGKGMAHSLVMNSDGSVIRPNVQSPEVRLKIGMSDATQALFGTLLLWINWYSFNTGSALGATGQDAAVIAFVALNTSFGAAAGGMAGFLVSYTRFRKVRVDETSFGLLGGLVAVTGGCNVIPHWAAWITGFIGGGTACLIPELLAHFHIDDPVGAFAVHGPPGLISMISIGLFAQSDPCSSESPRTGLFVGGNADLLGIQLLGALCIALWSASLTAVTMFAIQATVGIRVTAEEERIGLDVCEHGVVYEEDDDAVEITAIQTDNGAMLDGINYARADGTSVGVSATPRSLGGQSSSRSDHDGDGGTQSFLISMPARQQRGDPFFMSSAPRPRRRVLVHMQSSRVMAGSDVQLQGSEIGGSGVRGSGVRGSDVDRSKRVSIVHHFGGKPRQHARGRANSNVPSEAGTTTESSS